MVGFWNVFKGTLRRSGAQGDYEVLYERNVDSWCRPQSVDADTVERYRV